jgi:hypothetical protein
VVVLLIFIVNLIKADEDLIIVAVEQLLDDNIDDWQQDSEVDGILVDFNVHVHRVCALDLVVKVRLLVIDKKLIVLLPSLGMLLQGVIDSVA